MTANIPTIEEIFERMKNNYIQLAGEPVGGDQSAAVFLMQSAAGAIFEQYQHLERLFENGFVHLADEKYLALHGADFGLQRFVNRPTQVEFSLRSSDPSNSYLASIAPNGWIEVDGHRFTYKGDAVFQFDASVPNSLVLEADEFGDLGIDETSAVTGTGGFDDLAEAIEEIYVKSVIAPETAESLEEYRARILDFMRNTPLSGALFDYERWAREVSFVRQAWAFGNVPAVGSVTVYVLSAEGLPTNEQLATVQGYIEERRPVTATVIVASPRFKEVNIAVEVERVNIDAQTPAGNILRNLFERSAKPGNNMHQNQIIAALGNVQNIGKFTITIDGLENGEVPAEADQILQLGNITWQTS